MAEPVDAAFDDASSLPVLSFYTMSLAPYELNLAKRIASELPVRLHVLVARHDASRDWEFDEIEGLELEDLSQGDRDRPMMSLSTQLREWRRGGEVIRRLRASGARAVILAGYNDIGRLRVAWWCQRQHRPVFLRADSNLADEARKSWLKRGIKRVFLRVVRGLTTAVLSVGPQGVAYWRDYGESADRIYIVPYDPEYTLVESVSDDEVAEAMTRRGLDPARRRLVFSGRLTSVKRVDLLIEAFAAVAEQRPEWDLFLLGDGELRGELEARVPEALRDRVQWAGFVPDQRSLACLYRASDALVLPSDYEPWAVVVNEAAAAGLAIVVSEIVGARSALVRSGVNGESFPPGNLDALVQALLQVTDANVIDRYKSASPGVLAEWRRDHDPVEGLRTALVRSGVLAE